MTFLCCYAQAELTVQSRMDVHALFRPVFAGIAKDLPSCMIAIESKVSTPPACCTHAFIQASKQSIKRSINHSINQFTFPVWDSSGSQQPMTGTLVYIIEQNN